MFELEVEYNYHNHEQYFLMKCWKYMYSAVVCVYYW